MVASVALLAAPLALGLSLVIPAGMSPATAVSTEDDPGAPAEEPAAVDEPAAETVDEPVAEVVDKPAAVDEAADPADEAADPADEAADPADDGADPLDEAADETDQAADPADDGADPLDEAADETDQAADEPTDEPSTGPISEPAEPTPTPTPSPEATSNTIVITVNGAIGTKAGEVNIAVQGSGAAPGAQYSLWVFSQPQLLTSGAADAAGSFTASAQLPSSLAPGDHTVVLETTGSDGQALKSATGITIGDDGTLQGVVQGVDSSQLAVPKLSDNPKAPKYAPVAPLDNPAAVAATAVAALTVATVAGAAASAAAGGGGSGGSGGGEAGEGLEAEVRRRKSSRRDDRAGGLWRATFEPDGNAIGDISWFYRAPGLALIDRLSYVSTAAAASKSPLLSRCIGDAAPLRAMFGSLSALLPIGGLILGVIAGVSVDGVAQPAAVSIMVALILIGIFDAFAGIVAALAFTLVVAVSGGIIDASSVRTLAGIGLLIVGPGIIGGSFRDIRRPSVSGSVEMWERLTDLVVVPLLGAWVTYNIVGALPGLGGSAFPIADSASLFAYVVLGGLIAKILVEDAAARWFPERMDSLTPDEPDEAPTSQRIISALLRMGVFAFISAAFVGNVWQLWVASLLFLTPALSELIGDRFPNSARLWQAIPEGVPLVTFMLIVSVIISTALVGVLGESPEYAQTMFVILAVPGFILALLGVFGREPVEGDTRWYQRPSMASLYRIGGVVVLAVTTYLALTVTIQVP
jgi:hypothetical protein